MPCDGKKLEYIRGSLLEGLPTSVVDAEINRPRKPLHQRWQDVYKRDIQAVKQKAETTSTPKQNQYPAAPLCAPEAGDYVPNFIALGKGYRKLDIQSKAHRKTPWCFRPLKAQKKTSEIHKNATQTLLLSSQAQTTEEIEPINSIPLDSSNYLLHKMSITLFSLD